MCERNPNKHYFSLVSILLIPLIIITIYSFAGEELNLGGIVLQQANIRSYFLKGETNDPETSLIDSTQLSVAVRDSAIVDTAAQRILLFGDSMVEGLSKRMRCYAAENGHELLNVIWYSSSTKIWSQSDTLDYYIRRFEPTYVMLCLGGNELFIRDLDKRDGYIKTIIGKIGETPYVWIGPPNWKEDTGINDLIKKNAGTGRYFPSKRLTFERKDDGAHPTPASAAQWMDSVATWVSDSAACRIRMTLPRHDERSGQTITLFPLR